MESITSHRCWSCSCYLHEKRWFLVNTSILALFQQILRDVLGPYSFSVPNFSLYPWQLRYNPWHKFMSSLLKFQGLKFHPLVESWYYVCFAWLMFYSLWLLDHSRAAINITVVSNYRDDVPSSPSVALDGIVCPLPICDNSIMHSYWMVENKLNGIYLHW